MAFLAPLFLAGLAAIALPVLLHLRKKRPQETVVFSSLMFLDESPPITKRRSRLQDILLLLLRCLALALLILAFARPFFQQKAKSPVASDGSVMNFILIDASASMRGASFEKAVLDAREVIAKISARDWIALGTFSGSLHPLLSPEHARELGPDERKAAALAALEQAKADWQATRLDASLIAAVAAAGEKAPLLVHLIGDFQKGSAVDRLRGENWPDHLQIILHPVALPEKWTNAGVRILPLEKQVQRVRLSNSEGSVKSDFTLAWGGKAEKSNVSVPPGESAVFEAPPGLGAEGTVTLSGDDFPFDNEAWWTTPVRPVARIWYPDQGAVTDTNESAYFLNRAMQATSDYSVEIVSQLPAETPALAITGGMLDAPAVASLRGVIEAGGNALLTVRDAASAGAISKILNTNAGETKEAKVSDHARLGEIDFTSSVFAPFADARYSDFSGIRFWKYRVLPSDLVANGRVLARFDSGDPAWVAFSIGKGSLHVLATTWRPVDSQLALTTKFPPLLHSLLAVAGNSQAPRPVGYSGIEVPGIYEIGDSKISVQVDPAESELTPLPESEFRTLGLPLDPPAIDTKSVEATTALSNMEQESRQRVGWWMLVAAAAFFLAETVWAALAGGRPTPVTP